MGLADRTSIPFCYHFSLLTNPPVVQSHNKPVGGHLVHYLQFWIQNIKDLWSCQIVKKGYMLEFENSFPPVTRIPLFTTLSKDQHPIFLEEIYQMLAKGAIKEIVDSSPGFYSTFFIVPKKDCRWRPVLNLKKLNLYIKAKTFKMITPQKVLQFLEQGDWLASIDLKDAYFHIPIFPKH